MSREITFAVTMTAGDYYWSVYASANEQWLHNWLKENEPRLPMDDVKIDQIYIEPEPQ